LNPEARRLAISDRVQVQPGSRSSASGAASSVAAVTGWSTTHFASSRSGFHGKTRFSSAAFEMVWICFRLDEATRIKRAVLIRDVAALVVEEIERPPIDSSMR
jgi:hypothetical protein